jgi:2,3-bisphosphoglycerate-independent phosphoglycerate mutase
MKCILVILDGLGDRGHAAFGGKTPLMAARTPNLDRLAALGMNGLYHSFRQGVAMPSETAHFLMFGYGLDEFPGRGYIEALGEGIAVGEDEAALLARLFSVRPDGDMLILQDEDPEIDPDSCRTLQNAVRTFSREGIEAELVPTRGTGGILILHGDVSAGITDSNPIHQGRPVMEVMPVEENRGDRAALASAAAVNAWLMHCYRTLSAHPVNADRVEAGLPPVNAAGTQRAGKKKPVVPFAEKWGFKALAIASGPLYRGLSLHVGMQYQPTEDSGDPGKDLLRRLKAARDAKGFDFVYVHTKAIDEASHLKDPEIKKGVIESIDGAFAFALDEIAPGGDTLLVVTSDHSTASTGRMIHSGESVPLLMVGKYTRRDRVERFDEVGCASGALGCVRGKELMYLVLNFLDRGQLFGLMDSPSPRPFFPAKTRPLKI